MSLSHTLVRGQLAEQWVQEGAEDMGTWFGVKHKSCSPSSLKPRTVLVSFLELWLVVGAQAWLEEEEGVGECSWSFR